MKTVKIASYSNSFNAGLMKSALESEGIEAFLANENITQTMTHLAGMTGVQLFVFEKDAERAMEIIGSDKNIGFEGDQEVICPNCGSKNTIFYLNRNKIKKYFLIFVSLFFLSALGNSLHKYYCRNCKTVFEP